MKIFRLVRTVAIAAIAGILSLGAPPSSRAQDFAFAGPNSDLPDSSLVMPFAAKGNRRGFFAISNIGGVAGAGPVRVDWVFYDEQGEKLAEVARYIPVGGTDIVDVAAVRSKDAEGNLGRSLNLVGSNGFAVASMASGDPDLVGFWTIANIDANSSYGGNGAGLGSVGVLVDNPVLMGTSFSPESLGDNLLIILGIDDSGSVPTSLTGGTAAGATVFRARVSLYANEAAEGLLASVDVPVAGTALFSSLEELFPAFDLTTALTVTVEPTTPGIAALGFYGQAVGQFGAGQALRTDFFVLTGE